MTRPHMLQDTLQHQQDSRSPTYHGGQSASASWHRVISMRYSHKASEIFAYQATILRAERNYEAGRWVMYDRQFKREALARRDLDWSRTDPRFYNEAFTGRARSIPGCTFCICLQVDHTSQYRPKNPNRPWIGWCPDPSNWHAQPSNHAARPQLSWTRYVNPLECSLRHTSGKTQPLA